MTHGVVPHGMMNSRVRGRFLSLEGNQKNLVGEGEKKRKEKKKGKEKKEKKKEERKENEGKKKESWKTMRGGENKKKKKGFDYRCFDSRKSLV